MQNRWTNMSKNMQNIVHYMWTILNIYLIDNQISYLISTVLLRLNCAMAVLASLRCQSSPLFGVRSTEEASIKRRLGRLPSFHSWTRPWPDIFSVPVYYLVPTNLKALNLCQAESISNVNILKFILHLTEQFQSALVTAGVQVGYHSKTMPVIISR